jgi:drug/metabolite transporter (DMT)-like permease
MTTEVLSRRTVDARVWGALAIVYVVWGSTYLAIRVVVRSMPPFAAMGARFLIAGALMALLVRWRGGRGALAVPRRGFASAALVGVLLLVAGNGGVALAERTVPSGLAALLVSAMPLWLVLIRTVSRDRPPALSLVGTGVGFVGIAVLARPGTGGPAPVVGILVILGGSLCWAMGLFLSPRLPMPDNPFVATTYEMLAAGAVMTVLAPLTGQYRGYTWSGVQPAAWWALAYLVVFGSLVAFTAFVWLAGTAPLSLVSTYAYVNPVVAVLLGWAFLAEPVTWSIVGGGALAVLGVLLVVRSAQRRAQPVAATREPRLS